MTEYYHGTKADLKRGDLIAPGYASNYGSRKKKLRSLSQRNFGGRDLGR